MPSVVNVVTSRELPSQARPFMNDPFFRRFFRDDAQDSRLPVYFAQTTS